MSLKRGKYSKGEAEFVIKNALTMSARQIAKQLGRDVISVENLMKKRNLKSVNTEEEENELKRLQGVLHTSPHWNKILLALTEKEIPMFESDWVQVIKQFGEDVWYTEELYIVDWLLLNIKKYRTYKLEKEALQQIENTEDLLEFEYEQHEEDRDKSLVKQLEQELALQKAALSQHTTALKSILERIEKISEKLKANREERRDVKVSDDTYWGYIKMLEDEEFRKKESRQAQLMSLAEQKAREKLYEYHQYADGELDIPLLTPEIVIRKHEEEQNDRIAVDDRGV